MKTKKIIICIAATVLLASCEKKSSKQVSEVDVSSESVSVAEDSAIVENLSDKQESADTSRRKKILAEAWAWFEFWEEKLSDQMTIDTNPYHIFRNESGEEYKDFREFSGVDFHFLQTYDSEKDFNGWFLESAVCYGEGEDYPEFLPFKTGDSLEKVIEILGEENMPSSSDSTVHAWENGSVIIKVKTSDAGTVETVTLEKEGW